MNTDRNTPDRQIVEMLVLALAEGGVLARVRLGASRDAVLMAAAVARMQAEPGLRALVIAPTDHEVAGLKTAFDAAGRTAGITCATLGRDGGAGETAAVIGSLDTIAARVASGGIDARSFGLVALSDIDGLADVASAAMLRRALGPAIQGRCFVAFSAEPGPAHRALARDLGGTIAEMELEAGSERAKTAPVTTFTVSAEDKARLLLGILQQYPARPVAVFCDLRDTAESTARLLRTRGIKTEYILGNLPRKRAILDSVVAGAYEVLVLTDEGAAGLPAGWAASLVNWDLPLDGEPYLARLEHIDADDARVINFACERYSVGIPAIERVLGMRLEPARPEAAMMTPQDSRVKEPERKRPEERRDRGEQYDGRNARAIQADIAAITGGKISAPVQPATNKRPRSKTDKRRGSGSERSTVRDTGERTPGRNQAKPAVNKAQPRRAAESSKPVARNGGRSRGGKGQQGPRLADPYSVTMEERLRMYRERYGADPSGADRRGAGKKQPRQRRPEARPVVPVAPPAQETKKPEPARGIVGMLKGLFGTKDE
jgi:ATP-dependent RNA helicase RhlB